MDDGLKSRCWSYLGDKTKKVVSNLVPKSVKHHRVEAYYDDQRQKVAQNEETALKSVFCDPLAYLDNR